MRFDIYLAGPKPFGSRSQEKRDFLLGAICVNRNSSRPTIRRASSRTAHVPFSCKVAARIDARHWSQHPGPARRNLAALLQRCSPEALSVRLHARSCSRRPAAVVILGVSTLFVVRAPRVRKRCLRMSRRNKSVVVFSVRKSERRKSERLHDQRRRGPNPDEPADRSRISKLIEPHERHAVQKAACRVLCAKSVSNVGVAHVVEGSVQRAANKVRVNACAIDRRPQPTRISGHKPDDRGSGRCVRHPKRRSAKAIVDESQAKLSPNEKKAIEQPPTTDLAAFDLYSRAKSLVLTAGFSATTDPDRRKAIELLDEAVKRDPSFFDAYCQLAYGHEQLYATSGSDHTPERLALAEAAVQAATRLRPDAAETHLARANYLYYGLRDYASALAQLEIARRALSNDPRLLELTGYILRRRGQRRKVCRTCSARWSWTRATFLLCKRSRSVTNIWGAMPRQ